MIRLIETKPAEGVVIIGRNEGERLQRCFDSVVSEVPVSRVIYVDSGSTDGSVSKAREMGIEVVNLDTAVPFTAARARNAGYEQLRKQFSSLKYVQFLDGDCELRPEWIQSAKTFMEENEHCAVVCGRRRERHPHRSVYNLLIDLEWDTPIGQTRSCGGDAFFRCEVFEQVGGYCEQMIAGEEPELCVRLRDRGWTVFRLDQEMTLHDADLQSFGQWWKRCKRYGHAAFEGCARHGNRAERFMLRECLGIFTWGWLVWLAASLATLLLWPWGLAAWLFLPVQVGRLTHQFRNSGQSLRLSFCRACLLVICKPAEFIGGMRFLTGHVFARPSRVMEYKSESVSLEDGEEKPLSIAYVVPSYPELSETFVWREVAAMTQAGHKVLIVALREAKTVAQDVCKPDVVIYRRWPTAIRSIARTLCTRPRLATKAISSALFDAVFPGEKTSFSARAKCLVQAFAGISIARKLSSARCSVIHAQFAHASASVAMYASIATGIPWTMTGHANDLFERRQLLRRKLSRSNGVACISDWHASLYRRISLTVSKKLATVRCGVDVPRSSGRNLLTDGKSPFRVISVGRLVEKKGFDQLLRAYSELRDQVSVPTSLSVIGDGPEFHRLTLLARSLGVQEHVHFFGACEHRNVRMEISKAQCFVLACREDSAGDRDGIPIVLMEAMACGVPAVSGCIDAIHELIEHEKTGLLVDATATSSLAKTIQSVVENPSHAREMGARGRERIISEFSTVENSKRLEDLFRSACMG